MPALACECVRLSVCVICFRFIPRRTLPCNIRIDQARCRRKCPAEGWTDGLWCTERRRRRGEQKEKERKKRVGLLRTVSKKKIFSSFFFLVSSPALKVKMLRRVSDKLSPAMPFTSPRLLLLLPPVGVMSTGTGSRCCISPGVCDVQPRCV